MASIDRDLTQGSVTKQLVRYALPLVTTSLLQSLYSIADYIVAGYFISSAGQSAMPSTAAVSSRCQYSALHRTPSNSSFA